ncbi:MAG: hypothetical protein QOI36_2118 [Pseudonocardiales bacterium]|jgi:hypothetical protein|nr:hypothetical protein [Pseudonocardiales bacterium]
MGRMEGKVAFDGRSLGRSLTSSKGHNLMS